MKKYISLISTIPMLLSVTACGASTPYVTQETLEARLAELRAENESLNTRIDSVRECEEWRSTYVREGTDCINGLQPLSLMLLSQQTGEELTEELVYERRVAACMFACSFEQQCEQERQEVCEFVEAHRASSESSDEAPEDDDTEEEITE